MDCVSRGGSPEALGCRAEAVALSAADSRLHWGSSHLQAQNRVMRPTQFSGDPMLLSYNSGLDAARSVTAGFALKHEREPDAIHNAQRFEFQVKTF